MGSPRAAAAVRVVALALLLVGCPVADPDDTGLSDDTGIPEDTGSDTSDSGLDTSDSAADTSDSAADTSDSAADTSDSGLDTGLDTDHPHDTSEPHACDVEDTGLPVPVDRPDLIPLLPTAFRITERVVTESDCAWVEGCVGALGRRRLLRFDGAIANVGDGDLAYGLPEHHPAYFQYSLCHGHHHFTDFATWDLRDDADNVVAVGHKQAFCLTDSGRYLDDASWAPRYDCFDQGISRGWFDVYRGHLDCQWVDVTDVPPGDYVLRVEIDPRDIVPETDDGNNVTSVVVTVPDLDITRACAAADPSSLQRDCGWHERASATCQPGEEVSLTCTDGATCGEGCSDDPMLRVCEGDGEQCLSGGAWAANDDGCGWSGCPRTVFSCPPSGVFTPWVGRVGADAEPTCHVAATTAPIDDPTAACPGGGLQGARRECGWTSATLGTCVPGDVTWVGCDAYTCGLDVCPSDPVPDTLDGMTCAGDPMLRACAGAGPCHAREALALAEDACGGPCPAATFTCPPAGEFTVLVAPERVGLSYACDLGYAPVDLLNVPDTGDP